MLPAAPLDWPKHLEPPRVHFAKVRAGIASGKAKRLSERQQLAEALAFCPPRLERHSEVTPRMIELGREMERILVMGAIREASRKCQNCKGAE
jgi:hypothetical protein